MLEQDLIFLRDSVHYRCMNRLTAASALYEAGKNCNETAAIVLHLLEGKGLEEAMAEVLELNNGVRVQAILVAKMFAEMVGAMEDLGALCWAVRHRDKGLLWQYLNCETDQVGTIYAEIADGTAKKLTRLLNVPPLGKIGARLGSEKYALYERSYEVVWDQIQRAARSYRMQLEGTNLRDVTSLPPDWSDFVPVLLEVDPPVGAVTTQSTVRQAKGILPQTYNKIKHGFNVIESLDLYLNLAKQGASIRVAFRGRTTESAEETLLITREVSAVYGEVCALIQTLHEDGLG